MTQHRRRKVPGRCSAPIHATPVACRSGNDPRAGDFRNRSRLAKPVSRPCLKSMSSSSCSQQRKSLLAAKGSRKVHQPTQQIIDENPVALRLGENPQPFRNRADPRFTVSPSASFPCLVKPLKRLSKCSEPRRNRRWGAPAIGRPAATTRALRSGSNVCRNDVPTAKNCRASKILPRPAPA